MRSFFDGLRSQPPAEILKPVSEYGVGYHEPGSSLLSESVRYDLKYAKGELSESAIDSLIQNGMNNYALYFLLKGAESFPDRQRDLLSRVVMVEQEGYDSQKMQDTLTQFLQETIAFAKKQKQQQGASPFVSDPEDPALFRVDGRKLVQYNSKFDYQLLQERFSASARDIFAGGETPFCLAFASALGLRPFIQEAKKTRRSFHILVPAMIDDADAEYCGFTIDPMLSEPVSFLPKDFDRTQYVVDGQNKAVLFDDAVVTGDNMLEMYRFWIADDTYPGNALPGVKSAFRFDPQNKRDIQAQRNAAT